MKSMQKALAALVIGVVGLFLEFNTMIPDATLDVAEVILITAAVYFVPNAK